MKYLAHEYLLDGGKEEISRIWLGKVLGLNFIRDEQCQIWVFSPFLVHF